MFKASKAGVRVMIRKKDIPLHFMWLKVPKKIDKSEHADMCIIQTIKDDFQTIYITGRKQTDQWLLRAYLYILVYTPQKNTRRYMRSAMNGLGVDELYQIF